MSFESGICLAAAAGRFVGRRVDGGFFADVFAGAAVFVLVDVAAVFVLVDVAALVLVDVAPAFVCAAGIFMPGVILCLVVSCCAPAGKTATACTTMPITPYSANLPHHPALFLTSIAHPEVKAPAPAPSALPSAMRQLR